ncbi:MAG TPA: succinate dehydrogenase cytochrome b subunit [Vicinamibacteria bacterium]|nr:succinate dehydrogenase cytochrome b subunit [Vicinamibacteria bacterium]
MNAAHFFGSSIGKKVVMAVTGLVLFGFVVGHMIGNLQVYLGPEPLNAYGALLRHMLHGVGIWVVRSALLACIGLHIWAATSLTLTSWKARPVGYRQVTPEAASYASRTMRWSGPLLGLFIGYHLFHLTLGSAHPSFKEGDVYHNVIAGFSMWPVSAFYIVAMLALGLHMFHGVWSLLQSLGLSHPRFDPLRKRLAALVTGIVVLGNISIPVSVLTGLIR